MLVARNVSKSYGGVQAVSDVSLTLRAGEIHALCGENGAGKSTLIKCLAGVVAPDAGTLHVDTQPLAWGRVPAMEAAGIVVIHQESTVFPDLNVVDNLLLGHDRNPWWLPRSTRREQAAAMLRRYDLDIDLDQPVGSLSVGQRKLLSLARGLAVPRRVLVLDEPTASLSQREAHVLMQALQRLRDGGLAILYVTHRLEEVFALSDCVTVLRDGQHVETCRTADVDRPGLIARMVGRRVNETQHAVENESAGAVVMQVEQLTGDGFYEIDLSVHAGEIVGVAGLVGAGRSELARAVFGVDRYHAGTVTIDGQSLPPYDVRAAIERGVALVPEDRQHEGLVLPMSVAQNLTLASLRQWCRWYGINVYQESRFVNRLVAELQVRATSPRVRVDTLSGGNQQKTVIGKWLACSPRLLILDEPTCGVDVGAKAQVHAMVRELARRGMGTLLISSDLPELLALSTRVVVMRSGRLVASFTAGAATQAQVIEAALPRGHANVPSPTDMLPRQQTH